jgi:hypothetical protein
LTKTFDTLGIEPSALRGTKIMVSFGNFDRREFLALSALTTAASLLPKQLHATPASESDGVALRITGDAQSGYGVAIFYSSEAIARHQQGGEFSAVFQNTERSLEDRVDNWKATTWKGDGTRIALAGLMKLPNLRTNVFAQVHYEVINQQVVKKTIQLQQADMYTLLYQLTNRLEPETAPAKLWSFDQPDCKGGTLHEYFPAAGFRTQSGVTAGLLTDSGYRNEWSRIIRRDGTPIKPAPASMPDLYLYSLPELAERGQQGAYIQQTFGEATVQLTGEGASTPVILPAPAQWKRGGGMTIEETGAVVRLSSRERKSFVLAPFAAKAGEIYDVHLKYRCEAPIQVHAWDVDDDSNKVGDITLFNDTIPASPATFSEFHSSFVIPTLLGVGAALAFSLTDFVPDGMGNQSGKLPLIEVCDVEVVRVTTHREPEHRLEMGHEKATSIFIFANGAVPDTIRGYRLASQLHLAEGLGFKGGETEKVLYADVMMLSWNAEAGTARPMLAPSIWYSAAGEMYLRDSFYSLNGIHNRELNEKVFSAWADNQGEDGAINTLVEPQIANVERKSNDSTPLWLMWALLNHRRFGTELDMAKIRLAAEYCLATYDPQRKAICNAQFVIGQLDVIHYPQGTTILCENQGMLAVLLRVIRELGIPEISASISDQYIAKAEQEYRSYYNAGRGFMFPARNIEDAIGFSDIFPEFLSLWLFKRPILTDEMVLSHLDHIPAMLPRKDCPYPMEGGTVRPIFIGLPKGKGWSYFTDRWHPMVSDSFAAGYADKAADGIYYNGGSWMRVEICGYVTGKLHGWKSADRAIANRLWAETHTDETFPTSQEYLTTSAGNPFYGFHRVFAWNAFVLQALELAGMREPSMDPDYQRVRT